MWIDSTTKYEKKIKSKTNNPEKTQQQPLFTGWENLPPIGAHINTIPRTSDSTIEQSETESVESQTRGT